MTEPTPRRVRCVDATLSLDESVRMARASWTVRSLRRSPDHLQDLSHLGVCPDAVTHLDLPASYVADPCLSVYRNMPYGERVQAAERAGSRFRRPFTLECVVLNCLGRQWWMEDMLRQAMQRQGLHSRLPGRPVALWAGGQYATILNALEIRLDEVQTLLRDVGASCLRDAVVVLYTGWRAFTPLYRDCSHPHWWAWHPFLLYPHLSRGAAHWLRDQGAAGIATDAVSVDSPLHHWGILSARQLASPWEPIREAVGRRAGTEAVGPDAMPMDVWMPVHDCLLGSERLVMESLQLVSDVLYASSDAQCPTLDEDGLRLPLASRARITVLPFTCGPYSESLLAYVLILPSEKPE